MYHALNIARPAHHGPRKATTACVLALLALLAVGLWPAAPARAGDAVKVALVPLETLGSESKVSARTEALVASGLATVPGHEVIAGNQVRRELKKDARLSTCAGKADCLAQLGKKLGARYIVFGEVGGLGAAEVVYLELIDVGEQKSVRATTLELGQEPGQDQKAAAALERAARAAAYRLLLPDRVVGRLAVVVDTKDASIYVDGQRMAKSPAPAIELPVGSHAVRITHPEFHDFVRFVDIEFDETTRLEASLHEFPIVATDLARDPDQRGNTRANIIYKGQEPTPWYRRWYAVAGAGTVALIASALVVGVIADGIDADDEKIIRPPN